MMVSTRGRYALRVMIDLAEHQNGGYIPMKDVAARQDISLKYIEKIMPVLSKNDLVEGVHGKGGGYRLKRAPDRYNVWEILQLTEGDLAPVSCMERDAVPCEHIDDCRTFTMWKNLSDMISDYFENITIADLMQQNS